MTGFVDVCRAGELPCGAARRVDVDGRTIAVFHVAEGLFAIDDLCPHMGASLSAGHVDDCVVTCPWHAWRFDVRDGTWKDNPRIRTDSFPVRVTDGVIQVGLPEKDVRMADTTELAGVAAGTAPQTPGSGTRPSGLELADFQQLIRRMYFEKDQARGVSGTFMWLMEEIGELATALRGNDRQNLAEEFADVLAWLATIANVAGVDLTAAVREKYGTGCPGCRRLVCVCPDAGKP